MTPLQKVKRSDVLRIVGITEGQLSYWQRLRLLQPAAGRPGTHKRVYTFSDLVRLRSVKQLTGDHVSARRLGRAVEAFRRRCPEASGAELAEARFLPAGRGIAVDFHGSRVDPVSGQILLPFEAEDRKVCSMPSRSLEDWLALAVEYGNDPATRGWAIEGYRKVIERAPGWLEPRLNLGTLLYEQGDCKAAVREFRRSVEIAPGNPLAHFNLASVLDDLGEPEFAVRHFEEALSLAPDFADAHFNLARVYEKLGARDAARAHWQRYLALDPVTDWAAVARGRLEALSAPERSPDHAGQPS